MRHRTGKNKRTGEFVSGGAGAGTQILTHGKDVRVPAESVLTFRLEQPFQLGTGNYSRDNGYDRNGNHHHDDYYHRQQPPPQ